MITKKKRLVSRTKMKAMDKEEIITESSCLKEAFIKAESIKEDSLKDECIMEESVKEESFKEEPIKKESEPIDKWEWPPSQKTIDKWALILRPLDWFLASMFLLSFFPFGPFGIHVIFKMILASRLASRLPTSISQQVEKDGVPFQLSDIMEDKNGVVQTVETSQAKDAVVQPEDVVEHGAEKSVDGFTPDPVIAVEEVLEEPTIIGFWEGLWSFIDTIVTI